MTIATETLNDDLAQAEAALAAARAKKAAADAAAAEELRLSDPIERDLDAAEAAIVTAQARGVTFVRAAAEANATLDKATAVQRALAEAAAAGDAPNDKAVLAALAARREAEDRRAFYSQVHSIAVANVETAMQHATNLRHERHRRNLMLAQERLNADFAALVPNQPDDAALKLNWLAMEAFWRSY